MSIMNIRKKLEITVSYMLALFGYKLERIGLGYLDARVVIKKAQQQNLSVCEYLESLEHNEQKKGRRDRIINSLKYCGIFNNANRICEIGAGTGMYTESILDIASPEVYEVYETDINWKNYLKRYQKSKLKLILHNADGISLKTTPTDSCDLVHSHGVFVYLPILSTLKYLEDSIRVCKTGGYIVFDCYLDTDFTLGIITQWLESEWRFPVLLPEKILCDFFKQYGLKTISKFHVIHGSSFVNYFVLQKQ